ncbi:MAG: tRNA-intron lyase [Candidatus Diapherotrites archaeon]|nr:tRNA-intron lyase [Candidatus Diapherotrites archaeon]
MQGKLLGKRVLMDKPYSKLVERAWGEKTPEGLVLSLYEAAYLLEKGKIRVYDEKGNELDLDEFLQRAETAEKEFFIKYVVFRDIRDRGFVIKTGYKFGTDFRVYPRGKKPGEAHTQFTVNVIPEEDRLKITEISRMVRLARAICTKLILAVVDSENEIVYYNVERVSL